MSEDPFAELRAQYRAALPARLQAIERLRAGLAAGTLPAARRSELHREVHSIAGSGRTFGLPELSTAASAAEALLEQPGEPHWARLRELFEAMAQAAGTELAAKTSRRQDV